MNLGSDTDGGGIVRWLAPVAVLVMLAGACGSDDGPAAEADERTTTQAPQPEGQATSIPSPGCEPGGTGDGVVDEERALEVDGVQRRYLVTAPEDRDGDTPVPLVLDFHGLMEGAEIHTQMTGYSELAREEGFVAVFPHATGDPLRWEADPTAESNPDLDYLDAMLEQLGEAFCIDESRRYVTGLSNGAMFTSLLLCERSELFAAAVLVAGITDPEGCDPERPVPVLVFHGTHDPIVLFNGGVNVGAIPGFESDGEDASLPEPDLEGEGYPATVQAWALRHGCDPEHTDEVVSDEVVRRTYDCPDGVEVVFLIVLGGGHSWPSSDFSASIEEIVGPTTFEVDATRDGWAFMQGFAAS